jgi:hypothetical protein
MLLTRFPRNLLQGFDIVNLLFCRFSFIFFYSFLHCFYIIWTKEFPPFLQKVSRLFKIKFTCFDTVLEKSFTGFLHSEFAQSFTWFFQGYYSLFEKGVDIYMELTQILHTIQKFTYHVNVHFCWKFGITVNLQ